MSKLKVCETQCNQCLFSENRIVSDARARQIIAECSRNDSYFICHKTKDAVCRGFYDRFSTNLIRIMQRLNGIEFVNVEDEANV